MELLDLKVVRGSNIWSNYRHQLIVMKIDLQELEKKPTHRIDGFADRIKKLMPSLNSHRCSEGKKGGFFQRVEQGTWMGHVIEHIALELQTLAGMDSGYGRTRSTDVAGVYTVVFAFRIEAAGKYAAHASIRIAEALAEGSEYNIETDIAQLKKIAARYRPGPTTASILDAAREENIPVKRIGSSVLILGHGNKQKKIDASVTSLTSALGIQVAQDKEQTKRILRIINVPVPEGKTIRGEEQFLQELPKLRLPIVIKPVDGNQGRGITTNIITAEQAAEAFKTASAISPEIIAEEFIEGDDFRILVINNKFVAASKRTPATVAGDGKSTIDELLEQLNSDPNRGEAHENVLTKIVRDEALTEVLKRQGYTLETVLPANISATLAYTANLSSGGTADDVTALVHPFTINMSERIAAMIGLDVCGIDVVAKDITAPLKKANGAVVEVNAGPGLRMHISPTRGVARNVVKPIFKMLLPGKDQGRIPLVCVTGTKGTTLCTKLIAHVWQYNGMNTAYASSEGLLINGHLIKEGDCTTAQCVETVLFDPTADSAVVECSSECILKSGLPFDTSDVAIVINAMRPARHIEDVQNADEMAKVYLVAAFTAKTEGYTLLNADDDLVYQMRDELYCKIGLFSLQDENSRIQDHCADGGTAIYLEGDDIIIAQGKWKTLAGKVNETGFSRDSEVLYAVLPAILASFLNRITILDIRKAISAFGIADTDTAVTGYMARTQPTDLEL